MPTTTSDNPKIFLSYSQKHTPYMETFSDLLRAMELEPLVFDYGADRNPSEHARDLISACDGFLGLLTPDEPREDGTAMYSSRVQAELAMAYANNKKMQLLAINGPDLAGLPYETNTVLHLELDEEGRIERSFLPKLFHTLREFEKRCREIAGSKNVVDDAPLKYNSIHFSQQILSPDKLVIQLRFDAVTLQNLETHQHHNVANCLRDSDHTMQLANGLQDITFKLIEPKSVSSKLKLLVNEPSHIRYRMAFSRPIQTGTRLAYAIKRQHANYLYYTYEEMLDAIENGNVRNVVMARERRIGEYFELNMPTDRLKLTFTFPTEYQPTNPTPIVMKLDEVNKAETERVKELLVRTDDPFDNKCTLSMDIPEPRVSYSYYLLYEPPKEELLQKLM